MSTFVLLGRNGDLLGILPMLYADSLKGIRHKLVVAAEFASLLEGVSYVDPVVVDLPHYDIAKACLQMKGVNGEVKCLQIKGPRDQVAEWTWKPAGITANQTPSFEQEPWRAAGRLNEWGTHPLVFDKRNPEREAALLDKVLPKRPGRKKPLMLVSSGGISSPFQYKELLHDLLALKFGKSYRIIDLATVSADRFFDLLALFERAAILVATDSGPLHLTRAVPRLPVVAITNDKPSLWFGTAWHKSHLWYCRYGDFPERATEMLRAIDRYWAPDWKVKKPIVVLVFDAYDGMDKMPTTRHIEWFDGHWDITPIFKGACGRDSENTVKDSTRHPYLKDSIRMGIQRASETDHVCLVRPSTQLQPGISETITEHESSYAYRIEGGTFKPVVDMFCASRDWWKAHMKEIPDLILSKDFYWSHALWAIFRKHGAVDVTGCVYREAKNVSV